MTSALNDLTPIATIRAALAARLGGSYNPEWTDAKCQTVWMLEGRPAA